MSSFEDLIQEYEDILNAMRERLRRAWQFQSPGCYSGQAYWTPAADVYETGTSYHLFVELAGVDLDAVTLTVDGGSLTVSGERSRLRAEDCSHIHQLEISHGGFQRVFRFPVSLDAEGVQSSYKLGILEIIAPKLQRETPVDVS